MLSDTPGQRAYQSGMHAYAPDAQLDADSIEAWTSGRLFQAAMSHLDLRRLVGHGRRMDSAVRRA